MFQVKLVVVLILAQTVFAYESVYDIIERRRHINHPRNLNLDPRFGDFASFRPMEYFPGARFFGNGYDNIGNGNIPARERLHYLPEVSLRRKYQRFVQHPRFYNYLPPLQDFMYENKNDYVFNQRGNSGAFNSDRFISSKEGSNQRQGMETFGNRHVSLINDSNKKENFGEKSFTDRMGENKSSIRSNRFSKKGHITKGFSNHHHKDETGNSTTFYDEFSDHGGQADFKDVADGYGNKVSLDQFSTAENGKYFSENEGKIGNYGSGSVKDDEKNEKGVISSENNFDKDEHFRFDTGNIGRRKNFIHFPEFEFPYYTDY